MRTGEIEGKEETEEVGKGQAHLPESRLHESLKQRIA